MQQDSIKSTENKPQEIRCAVCQRLLFIVTGNTMVDGIVKIEAKCSRTSCGIINQITCQPIKKVVDSE